MSQVDFSPDVGLGRVGWLRHILVFRTLGTVLLAAAGLKGYQLATAPVPQTDLHTSRWFLIGLIEFEAAFGLWLWLGLYPRQTRWAALAWFAVLLAASLGEALSGHRSCSCFGAVQMVPWAVAAFDLLALCLLGWVSPPHGATGPSLRGIRGLLLAVFLVVGTSAALALGSV